ncbi:hypothetical protein [Luteibacter sahnii]|uniref:hypothetical protein n=1 Tax=Luteibacter sahnii TaxID=3021977 RepID=UPI002A6AE21F|nr:hypothetical protein [Luteibacter sp. PPL193]MDY1549578.1 hypothetical protein [Luteibacter sp. PPL193]
MRLSTHTLLFTYTAALTTAIAVALFTGHLRWTTAAPSVLTVQQLRIVEPDGTLRTVLSNRASMPGLIVGGKQYPSDRESAGALFYDDEGSEVGGLLFNGQRLPTGGSKNSGSLTFDRYRQDQALQLLNDDGPDGHFTGMRVVDRSSHPLDIAAWTRLDAMPDGPAKDAERRRLDQLSPAPDRLFVGRAMGDATVVLQDGRGRPRLQLRVTEAGEATIEFMNASGQVVKSLGP